MRFFAVLALCLLIFSRLANAAPPVCNAGAEGTIIYNKDHKIVQFCDGTQWIGMVARIGDSGDTLADLTCANGEIAKWNGTAWACAADAAGSSVWLDGGAGKLYYNGGNIGIGTNAPSSNLHVDIGALGTGGIQVTDSTASGSQLRLGEGSGAAGDFLPLLLGQPVGSTRFVGIYADINPAEDSGSAATMRFVSRTQTPSNIATRPLFAWANSATTLMQMQASGNLGVGNTAPKTKLDVTGTIRMGDGVELCNSADHEGAIRYVAATDAFQMCRNSATGWEAIGTSGGGITALTGDVTASGTGSVVATIAANAIGSAEIAVDSIAAVDIATGGVGTAEIVDGTIARIDLADSIINSSAIADGQVTGTDITDGTVTAADIGTGAVGALELANASVAIANLSATGTASATTYLRGDNTWAAPIAVTQDWGAYQARSTMTSYTAGSPGMVVAYMVDGSTSFNCIIQGYVNGAVVNMALTSNVDSGTMNISFPVPNGATYQVNYGENGAAGCTGAGTMYFIPLQ